MVLIVVFILITTRQIGRLQLEIWQIMLLGAITVLLTGQISPIEAIESIDFDILIFLFGMFAIGRALEESGYLWHLLSRLFKKVKSKDQMLLVLIFAMGMLSAVLLNDTVAIIGTPLAIMLAKDNGISPKLLLLALTFSVTIGSVMSPIGNPQNLLIAMSGNIDNPFITFPAFLAAPTIINLFIIFILLKYLFKNEFNGPAAFRQESITDTRLTFLSKISLSILISLVFFRIVTVWMGLQIDIKLSYISLLSALPLFIFSERRSDILKGVDWKTIVFFAAMFVLMRSVWDTGFFQYLLSELDGNLTDIPVILTTSIIVSQLISNVPFVALFLPIISHSNASIRSFMALAAGSTVAGNLTILGAASNVIVIQTAENKAHCTLTFIDFLKVGAPLTVVNTMIYALFLTLI